MKRIFKTLMLLMFAFAACAPLPSIDTPNQKYEPETPNQGDNNQNKEPEVDLSRKADLIAHYTFNNTTDDQTPNHYDAVGIGDPSYVSDTPDGSAGALKINGFKGQFVNIPYSFMNGRDRYSVSFWVKDFGMGILFSAISSDYVRSDYPRLLVTDNQKLRFYAGYDNYDTSEPFSYDCLPVMSGDWHHIVITCSPSGSNYVQTVLYIDGVRVDAQEKYWSEGAAHKMVLGGDKDGVYTVSMSATYDNVRFYGCTLKTDEVKYLYNNRL